MGYWIARIFFIIIMRLFFRFKVEGRQFIPEKTNFIVASNHVSFLDPIVIGCAIPQRIYWVALRSLYENSLLRWLLPKFGVLPTGSVSTKMVQLLKEGKNVGIFPEGKRSFNGGLQDFKRGVAVLAMRSGRPVLPVAILGAYDAYPRHQRFPRLFVPITLRIGRPIHLLKEFEEELDDIQLQEGAFRIRNAIKELLYAKQ